MSRIISLNRIVMLGGLLLALIAVLFLAAPLPTAQAQSSEVLVSNFGQTETPTLGDIRNHDRAQGFTTGNNSLGYNLTSVELKLTVADTGRSTFTVAVHADNNGIPGSRLATLTAPQTLATGDNAFTHAGLGLSPSTSYFVVIDVTARGTEDATRISFIASDSEDSDSQAGWTIGDNSQSRIYSSTGDYAAGGTHSFLMRLKGAVKPEVPNLTVTPIDGRFDQLRVSWDAPTGVTFNRYRIQWKTGSQTYGNPRQVTINAPATSHLISGLNADTVYDVRVTALPGTVARSEASARTTPFPLVSNLTQSNSVGYEGSSDLSYDRAQEFTTGSRSLGYVLYSVDLVMEISPSHSAVFSLAIHESTGGNPGKKVADLDAPPRLATGVNRFTHEGLSLAPSTSYFVVIDVTTPGGLSSLTHTDSDGEVGAPGWSIGDKRHFKNQAGAWGSLTLDNYMIGINGILSTKPKWARGVFQPINEFVVNQPATFRMPAARGDAPLTYSLEDIDQPEDATSPVLTLPAGLTWNARARTISGTPTAADSRTYRYTVTDVDGDTLSINFILGVENTLAELSALSILPGYDTLELNWTRSTDTAVTGYLVQWKSGEQGYERWDNDDSQCRNDADTLFDCARSHLAAATAASYRITGLETDTEYAVRVVQLGGALGAVLHDGTLIYEDGQFVEAPELDGTLDESSARGKRNGRATTGATLTHHTLTVVRGGPSQAYQMKLTRQPPVKVALYPTHDLDAEYALSEWDTGEDLVYTPVLRFFTPDDPTAEQLAGPVSAAKWDTAQEFRVSAPPGSGTGTVTLYHGFIWDDETERDGFEAGTATVTIVDPASTDIVATITGGQDVNEGTAATFTVSLSNAAPAGGLTVGVWVSHVKTREVATSPGWKAVTVAAGQTSATLSVPTNTFYPLTLPNGQIENIRTIFAGITYGAGYYVGLPWYANVGVHDIPPVGGYGAPTQGYQGSENPTGQIGRTPAQAGQGHALTGLTVAPVEGEPTKLAVSWDALEGAAKYSVRWKTADGDYGDGVETTGTSYTVTGLEAGTAYTVNVAALTDTYTLLGEAAAPGTTEPLVERSTVAPWAITVMPSGYAHRLAVSWTAVEGATGYRVQWKSGDETYSLTTGRRHRL